MGEAGFPTSVRDDFVVWLNLLKKRGFHIKEGTDRITKTPLNSYHAERYCKEWNGVQVYLVGDAAAGFPYLRALNAGLILGSSLGKIIANNYPMPLFRYNTNTGMRVTIEEGIANLKNGGLNFFKGFVKLNSLLPSFLKWDKEEAEELRDPHIL
jgi:hypothetical protein